jgi:hypothetical protein
MCRQEINHKNHFKWTLQEFTNCYVSCVQFLFSRAHKNDILHIQSHALGGKSRSAACSALFILAYGENCIGYCGELRGKCQFTLIKFCAPALADAVALQIGMFILARVFLDVFHLFCVVSFRFSRQTTGNLYACIYSVRRCLYTVEFLFSFVENLYL